MSEDKKPKSLDQIVDDIVKGCKDKHEDRINVLCAEINALSEEMSGALKELGDVDPLVCACVLSNMAKQLCESVGKIAMREGDFLMKFESF